MNIALEYSTTHYALILSLLVVVGCQSQVIETTNTMTTKSLLKSNNQGREHQKPASGIARVVYVCVCMT